MIHPSLVLCTVPDETSLLQIRDKCAVSGITTRLFVETDMGEQVTALATAPIGGKSRKIFQKLKLFSGV